MKPPRLPPLIARRLNEFEQAVRMDTISHGVLRKDKVVILARRRRTLTLAIRKAIASGK